MCCGGNDRVTGDLQGHSECGEHGLDVPHDGGSLKELWNGSSA